MRTDPSVALARLKALVEGMTPGRWHVSAICDLVTNDEDDELATFYYVGNTRYSANLGAVIALRNAAEPLIAVAEAAAAVCFFDEEAKNGADGAWWHKGRAIDDLNVALASLAAALGPAQEEGADDGE